MRTISTYLPQLYPKYSTAEIAKALKNAGFTGLAVSWEEGAEKYLGLDGPGQADLADKLGLTIDQAHLTILGIGDLWYDDVRGDSVEERTKKEISEVGERGIPVAVTHMSYGMQAGPISDIGLERMNRIAAHAEEAGVYLALENSRDIPHLSYTLDRIKSDHLGFCYDSGHENEFTRHRDYLSEYGDRLLAVHLNDNDAVWDMHTLPFDGNSDWTWNIKRLKMYQKRLRAITLEPGDLVFSSYSNLSEEEIIRRTKSMAIYGNRNLLDVGEGRCVFYPGLDLDAYVERAYLAAIKVERMLTQ